MITQRELLKSAIATATLRIAKEEGEALDYQHRHARGQGPRRFPALLRRRPGLEPIFENKERRVSSSSPT
jgi:hypothetical protein